MSFRDTFRRLRGLLGKRLPFMMTCRDFEEFIDRWIDGELGRRQRAIFEFHLRMCPDCRTYLAAYRETLALGKKVFDHPEASIPDDVPEDLIQAILAAKNRDE